MASIKANICYVAKATLLLSSHETDPTNSCFLTLNLPVLAEPVCSVDDRDTIKLCTGQSIRFHGIDAPELHQPMEYESRGLLMSFSQDKSVDLNRKGKSYKRQVCRIWANGRNVEEEMVSQVWALNRN